MIIALQINSKKQIQSYILHDIETRILGVAERLDDEFTNIPILDLCNNAQEIEFNDSYYLELIKRNSLKLITTDRDFDSFQSEIDIIGL